MEITSLYVHVPFCVKKCLYCDFLSFSDAERRFCDYTDALVNEITSKSTKTVLESVFIGGGTPTVLSKKQLHKIMNAISAGYNIDNAEITIEANPGTLTPDLCKALRQMGINRISIGLQAWQDSLLKTLGRIHCQNDFVESFNAARAAGFDNISVDLMFALPNQTLDMWRQTLENVVALNPEHISAYSLIVEEGTPFFEEYRAERLIETDDKTDRLMYYTAKQMLTDAGYTQYEISNFAKLRYQSVHNKAYWQTKSYVGCGIGAHSYVDGKRYHNSCNLEYYIKKMGNCPDEDVEALDIPTMQEEFMFCGLRMTEGITYAEFFNRFGVSITEVYGDEITKLISQGLLKYDNERLFLTDRGIDISNLVFEQFLR